MSGTAKAKGHQTKIKVWTRPIVRPSRVAEWLLSQTPLCV